MRIPSTCSKSFSTAARRASVSRLPRPQSTRRRVRSVSSSVRLPELPDARMETRRPIEVSPVFADGILSTMPRANFYDDGRAQQARQRRRTIGQHHTRENPRKGLESAVMDEREEKPEALDRYWDPDLEVLGELLDQLDEQGAM